MAAGGRRRGPGRGLDDDGGVPQRPAKVADIATPCAESPTNQDECRLNQIQLKSYCGLGLAGRAPQLSHSRGNAVARVSHVELRLQVTAEQKFPGLRVEAVER